MATKNKVARHRSSEKEPASERRLRAGSPASPEQQLARELRSIAGSLTEALGDIIEAHTMDDAMSFTQALKRVQSARICLEGEAHRLELRGEGAQ